MVGKSSISIQSQAPGNWLRRADTRITRIQKKKEPSRPEFAPLFLMTAAPQVQRSSPLPFQVDPGSGFAQPWGRSRGGGQPRPCGMRPASSLCGKPISKVSQLAIISASPSKTTPVVKVPNIPLSGGGGTHSSLPEPGCTSSCQTRPHQSSQRSIREPLARRGSSGRDLESDKAESVRVQFMGARRVSASCDPANHHPRTSHALGRQIMRAHTTAKTVSRSHCRVKLNELAALVGGEAARR